MIIRMEFQYYVKGYKCIGFSCHPLSLFQAISELAIIWTCLEN